ncbi:MAG: Beta-lactamase [uncultured bacterium]|uniref:Beta-lactamase n=4 Tax=Candidatus Daviesiibacteriota TaxID=1752718 RepID=A0A0G0EPQ5_9BACT|nr:MAG: Beta-lactamase [uncultured bacterium]KKQ07487.1 MAG: Beta-lactamase [Candidatus Daviesbacteria bacterium GW2011_GWB1_36_5]KKQ14893.1 MAG: Beta-lactamase [Candidatus Daviesbacteria bacterium GW2011_GWA1_36_8]OGE16644.1 MAG: hypothetical protein A2858_02260 [Candidatus Daviesbacteria bacterium RIFCSPHIGHO2_01_FULL_36_37]OGE33375.1 MAG: hypothetical protein A3C99_01650 [Candidatus Daviesbacteria bacterium RIFCSPHIGHO2_02_FULL_37_9]OGE34720.1 MAG: hypothetical protein A3E66_03780 [Candidat
MAYEFTSFLEKRRQQRRNKKIVRILGFSIVILFAVFFIPGFLRDRPAILGELVKPNVKSTQATPTIESSKNLEQAVSKALIGTQGEYAVYIKNLKTNESFFLNEHQVFESGSLYKLWVMGEAFKQIEEGIIQEDEVLSQDIATLNRKFSIDPELVEQTEGGITLTVAQALNQMITISHNYAALLLTEKLKLSQVKKYLEDNGFKESQVGSETEPPKTTAFDTALFLEKLYRGELGSSESNVKMMELLKNQKLNKKLPKYLPEGTVLAHKTGEIGWFSHDGGIVFQENGDYIIVVLSESSVPAGAEDRIAKISEAAYQYFSQ